MRTWLEISDLIVDYDPVSLTRRPVRRQDVITRLKEAKQPWGARIVEHLDVDEDGVLDPTEVDRVLLSCHAEIQRLHEESEQGHRSLSLLGPMIEVARARGISPIRVVDIGCGIGFVMRWLAAHHAAPDVEYIGVDYNATLIRAAQHLADVESLPARFIVGNAFELQEPAHIYTSTGVIHHFRGEDLHTFFAKQRGPHTLGCAHFDIQASWASPIGAAIFHWARFHERVAHHDGLVSALRAHRGAPLLDALEDPTGEFAAMLFDNQDRFVPIFRIMQAAVGWRAELVDELREQLGRGARRLREDRP